MLNRAGLPTPTVCSAGGESTDGANAAWLGNSPDELEAMIAAPVPPPTTRTAAAAMRTHRCLARRLASAISGSSVNGNRRGCAVIALLSIAPGPASRHVLRVVPEHWPGRASCAACADTDRP